MNKECDYCTNLYPFKLDGMDEASLDAINKEQLKWHRSDNALICPDCLPKTGKGNILTPDSTVSPIESNQVIPINSVLKQSREIDDRVQVRTDLFNAETMAIAELKKAIDADESITNKQFALGLELQTRYNRFKQVIFELSEKIVEETNKQRATQIYLNQLANQLRAEEREKLKISDINYQPRNIKMPVTVKAIKLAKKRIDKNELRKAASELGLSEFSLQMMCVAKNWTVAEALVTIKKNIEDALASNKEIKS